MCRVGRVATQPDAANVAHPARERLELPRNGCCRCGGGGGGGDRGRRLVILFLFLFLFVFVLFGGNGRVCEDRCLVDRGQLYRLVEATTERCRGADDDKRRVDRQHGKTALCAHQGDCTVGTDERRRRGLGLLERVQAVGGGHVEGVVSGVLMHEQVGVYGVAGRGILDVQLTHVGIVVAVVRVHDEHVVVEAHAAEETRVRVCVPFVHVAQVCEQVAASKQRVRRAHNVVVADVVAYEALVGECDHADDLALVD